MDLVFFASQKDLQTAQKMFAKTDFVLGAHVSCKSDVTALQARACEWNVSGCAVLGRAGAKWVPLAKQNGLLVAFWPADAQALHSAVSMRSVDFVLQLVSNEKPFVDLSVFRLAKQNNICFLFLFTKYLNAAPRAQPGLFKNTAFALSLARNAGACVQFVSGAKTVHELRSQTDLGAFKEWLASHAVASK